MELIICLVKIRYYLQQRVKKIIVLLNKYACDSFHSIERENVFERKCQTADSWMFLSRLIVEMCKNYYIYQ